MLSVITWGIVGFLLLVVMVQLANHMQEEQKRMDIRVR